MEVKEQIGVGSCLKVVLSTIGFKNTEKCGCDELAKRYDDQGVEWCESHFGDIIADLGKRAKDLGYVWNKSAAQFILKRCINSVKKKMQKEKSHDSL